MVAVGLGELAAGTDAGRVRIVLTEMLSDFIVEFTWDNRPQDTMALAMDLHRHCSLLFLAGSSRMVLVDTSRIASGANHPLPAGSGESGLVDYWQEEAAKLLELDRETGGNHHVLAVACAYKFAGRTSPGYETAEEEALPLVGPDELDELIDGEAWQVPAEIKDASVSFADARKNCKVIGASCVDPPSGGSHYKVRFPGARPWVLDPNDDPVPEPYLKELEQITPYPIAVVKFALTRGELPPRALRLPVRAA